MYPGMELLVGSVAVILFMRYGLSFTFLATAVFFLLMLLVALVDWNHLMIPNEVIVAGLLAGLLLKALSGYRDIPPALLASLLSLLTLFSVLVLGSYLFKKEVMGMGDVKLAAVIGLFVGFQGFLVSLWIASVVGSIYGGVAYLTKTKRTTQSSNCDIAEVQKIPFGSFLSLASFTVFLFQEQIQGVLDLWWISIS
jgi:leader peptidase (prepilin peptidase)/N-methyltransferase